MSTFTPVTRKHFTLDDDHRLIDRVELICGELMQRVAKGNHHRVCHSSLYIASAS